MLKGKENVLRTLRVNATAAPALDAGEVHVWISRTNLPRTAVEGLKGTLSAEELERANLLRFEERRNQFLVSRGLLRIILARYAERPANELAFSLEPGGKPRLADGGGPSRLQFNLGHSGTICVIAVTRLEMVGVDVEEARSDIDMDAVARRILTGREWAEFDRLSAGERSSWLHSVWSKKEAFVKAMGVGMAMPFQEVETTGFWRNRSGSPFLRSDGLDFPAWWSESFVPAAGYVGAVATLGIPSSVSYRWEIVTGGAGPIGSQVVRMGCGCGSVLPDWSIGVLSAPTSPFRM
ncbi:MAG: 4'-phosphopantetheinyl transferase superfamily protein [Anaerolineales bacterium]